MTSASNELVKDMYAEFGLTYYFSEVLCTELGMFYVFKSFTNSNDMTRPRIEEKFVEAESLTLGQVIDRAKSLVSPDLQTRLDKALERRNYIAHRFWNERIPDMFSAEGVIELIEELRRDRVIFEELDQEIRQMLTSRLGELGLTDEAIEAHSQRILAGEVEPPLPSKRPLRKRKVCIIRAYDVMVENGGSVQIFEIDNGEFLQFCDVGLGWSNFTEAQSDWKVNEVLQPYFPANIVPRPEITETWNYEFELPSNAMLWVQKGGAEKTYKWGIRATKGEISKN